MKANSFVSKSPWLRSQQNCSIQKSWRDSWDNRCSRGFRWKEPFPASTKVLIVDQASSSQNIATTFQATIFAGLIGVLFIVGLIIKFIWWIIGAAALVGLFCLIRAILRANARQRAARRST